MKDYSKKIYGYARGEQSYNNFLRRKIQQGISLSDTKKADIIKEFKENNPKYADLHLNEFVENRFYLKRMKSWGLKQLLDLSIKEKQHPCTTLVKYCEQCHMLDRQRRAEKVVINNAV